MIWNLRRPRCSLDLLPLDLACLDELGLPWSTVVESGWTLLEITGWPPDGARTHPTTIAADWFSAAARAAVTRRGAAPHARIVIALPDTRRYRALAAVGGPDLATARTEVWFVDPTGGVEQTAPATGNGARRGSR